ncbi:MAG: ATP synthase F1 subunit delta, partial [Myxococcota bacterium]
MIRTSPIARRYAKALLELTEESKKTPKVRKDLDEIAAAYAASEDLRNAFRNPALTAEMRRNVLNATATRMMLDPLTKNTLMLMSDNQRLGHVVELAAAFGQLAEQASGTLRAEVISA